MNVGSAAYLLVVGVAWLLLMLWVLLSIAGVADPPENLAYALVYWAGYLAGPLILILGSVLLLRRQASLAGSVFTGLGCLVLTGFSIYNSVGGMQRSPLQAPPTYWFYGALLMITLLADLAGYKLVWPMLASSLKWR